MLRLYKVPTLCMGPVICQGITLMGALKLRYEHCILGPHCLSFASGGGSQRS
jgi:hypothetical protein